MTSSNLDIIARRHFLTLAALGAGVVLAPEAAVADDRSLLDIFADQAGRLDGKTVFWLTRGREYVIQGSTVKPVYDRHVISACRVIKLPDGGLKYPYVETAFATMPGVAEAAAQLQSPVTGKSYPNPIINPLRLTLWISPTGEITQEVKLEKLKVESHYKGTLSLVHSLGQDPLLSCEINVQGATPAGKLALTEMGPYQADPTRRTGGFTPATREIIVVRDAPAYLVGAGVTATMLGIHPSLKFASLGEIVKALTPVERTHYAGWMQSWERMLDAQENVILG
jgi:hypothetical protein